MEQAASNHAVFGFCPEPLDALRARFPEALRTVHDPELIASGLQRMPGTLRSNVFDFDDGLRLIVSVDKYRRIDRLHLSASPFTGKIRYAVEKQRMDANHFMRHALNSYGSIACKPAMVMLKFLGFTRPWVPHWHSVFSFRALESA